MITQANIWSQLKDLANNLVLNLVGTGRPVNGTTGANLAGSGSTYTNLSTGNVHLNTGTFASPVWELVTGLKVAKATYDFAVDGGAVSTITPAAGVNYIVPSGSTIIGGVIDILTTFTSGGSATISVGLSAGTSGGVAAFKAATAVATWTAGLMAIVPLFTAATMVKTTAAGSVTFTIA